MRNLFSVLPRAALGLLAGLALSRATPAQAAPQPATPLFGEAGDASLSRLDRSSRVRLARLQRVRLARAFSSKLATSTRLQLDVFANWKGVARLTRLEKRPGGLLWAGQIEGDRLSSVLLTVSNGRLTGHLNTTGGDFVIQSIAGVTKGSGGAAARGAGDDLIAIGQPEAVHGDWCGERSAPASMLSTRPSASAAARAAAGAPGGRVAAGAAGQGTQIDVMFVYSIQAKAANANIESDMQFTIDDANQTFANTGLATRLRLVHAEMVNYNDSGSLGTDLDRVTGKTDGFMDNVHDLRDAYGADLVCFVPAGSTDGYAGLAWVMGGNSVGPQFESLGFSAVDGDALLYAFSHEIGHNMGSSHDHVTDPNGFSAYPYSYGYINAEKGFYTIMSYTTACDAAKKSCRRVQWYSNPDLTENGAPTGIREGQPNAANNFKTFTNTTPIVADFRSSLASIIVPSVVTIAEGTGGSNSIQFTISRGGPTATALTLSYSFEDLTATNGSDYEGTAGTISFAAGQTSRTIQIPITTDARYEGNELFAINVSGDPSQVLASARTVVTIIDDDNPHLSLSGSQVVEGDGNVLPQIAFRLTLDGVQARTSAVYYTTRDLTAQSGTDYYPVSGVATIEAGRLDTTIAVPIRGDDVAEADETFELVLSNPSNVDLLQERATATILNDDLPTISVADTSVREASGGSAAAFTATLSMAWPQEVSVGYTTFPGTAGATDFSPSEGRITFAPGQVTQTISVPILDDLAVEPEKQFGLRLREARGARILDGEATAIVQDDDSPGLSVSDAQEVEGDGLGTITRYLSFTITLDTASGRSVAAAYSTRDGSATAGSDYDATAGTIVLAPGQTSAQVLVPLRGDLQVEDAETLQLVLSRPDGVRIAREAGTGTITNDDVPSISISDASVREAAGGSNAVFTVTLSNPWPTPISVAFRSAPGMAGATDFTAQSGRLTFAPGQTSLPIIVRVLDDAVFEESESFQVLLSEPQGGRIDDGAGMGTITSNDASPILSTEAAKKLEGNEGTGFLEFPIKLSAASSQRVSVSYLTQPGTATANSDYRAVTGEVVLAAGVVRGVIRIPIIGDRVIEKDETFTLVLRQPVNARLQAERTTGTILNDDRDSTPPTVSILSPRPAALSSAWPAMNGTATDANRVSRVVVRLQRLSDGRYWNGSAWVASTDPRTSFNASLSGTAQNVRWSVVIAPPVAQSQSGSYRLVANAFDAENNKAEASSTFRIDRSGPALTIRNPRDKSTLRALGAVEGTVTDVPAGVARVELSIQRRSDGRFWNGREWVGRLVSLPATVSSSSWRVATLPKQWNTGAYIFSAHATDKEGNRSDASATVSFVSSPAT